MRAAPPPTLPPQPDPPPRLRVDFDAQDREVSAELKQRTARGGLHTVAAQLISVALQTGSIAVLGRLLTPDDFGLIALISSLTGFMLLFREMGLPTAIVQARRLTHEKINTVFWINVALGTVLAGITAALAPAAAWFFDDPRLTAVTWVLAGLFVIGGMTVQHKALLRRTLRIGVIQSLQLAGQAAGVATAVTLALRGWNYWALVIAQVVSATVMLAGCWAASTWRPSRPGWGRGSGSLIKYGGELTASNLLAYATKNLDNILIGKVWGAASLGVYSKAYGLLMLPVQQLSRPMSGVVIPGLSRLQNEPSRFASYLYRAVHLMAFASLPLVVLLAWHADEVVRVVLGPQWGEAGPLFRVLALAALLQPINAGCTWLFLSSGRTSSMLRFSALHTLVVVGGFALTVAWGPWWMAVSFALASALMAWPQMRMATHNTPATPGGIAAAIRGPAAGTTLALGCLWAWPLFTPTPLPSAWNAIVGAGLAASAYLGFTALTGDLKQVLDVAKLMRNASRKSPPPLPASHLPSAATPRPLPRNDHRATA